MEIYYKDGPPKISMGAAGVFEKGVSREIDDKLAEQLLEKKVVVFTQGKSVAEIPAESPATPAKKAKSDVKQEEVANG